MNVYACEKCKYTDLLENDQSSVCPRCGGRMVSLGVNSAEWNRLGIDEIFDLINEKVGPEITETPEITKTPESLSYTEEKIPEKKISEEKIPEVTYSAVDNMNKSVKPAGRSVKPGIILAAVMLLCIGCGLFYWFKGRNNATSYPSPQEISLSTTETLEALSDAAEEIPKYEFENCLYYDAMGDREKEIYQIYYDLVMHKDDRDYSRKITIPLSEWETVEDLLFPVFYAMLADHPEFFYIAPSKSRVPSVEGKANNVAALIEFRLGPGEANENEMITKFDSAVRNFMREIDRSAPPEEIEMQIHDKLNDMVSYDRELLELGLGGYDLAHTAYGALVNNGRGKSHKAVCDGYACAYQYLLGKAGICAAQVTGTAQEQGGDTLWGDAYHAWNIVELDGEWYEVDCCWDDVGLEEMPDHYLKREIKKIEDKYFYVTHHWFNRTTEEMKHLPASERTRFFIPGYESFNFIGETFHERKIRPDEEGYELFEYLNDYLPEATGTRYALK